MAAAAAVCACLLCAVSYASWRVCAVSVQRGRLCPVLAFVVFETDTRQVHKTRDEASARDDNDKGPSAARVRGRCSCCVLWRAREAHTKYINAY